MVDYILRMTVHGSKVLVNGLNLYYEKAGHGEHVILLLPGALGSTKTDFPHQIEKLNRTKFTIIAWDPPGYGQSRPPQRALVEDYWHNDAELAAALMEELGYSYYSLVGYSDGAISAAILAARHQNQVRKLFLCSAASYITPGEIDFAKNIRDASKLHKAVVAPMHAIYGKEEFARIWEGLANVYINRALKGKISICADEIENIIAPTFILHGDKDLLIPKFHAIYLHNHIKNSRLLILKDCGHTIVHKYPQRFNDLVESFLTEPQSAL